MENFKDIIKSFSIQETLNPKVWSDPDDLEKSKLKPVVKKALDKIADKFIEYLGENVVVEDVVLTGSLSNYNWSKYSDFDLHIIIDFQQYESEADLYRELYNAKKQLFNDKYNIKIFGYDVELYAQDMEESHFASGTYSIMNDEWIKKPKKESLDIDKPLLINKIRQWVEKIDKNVRDEEVSIEKLEDLKSKIKEYRQSGLEKNGELSYENLVFKFLRRSGHIERLFEKIKKSEEKKLSVERKINEISTSNKLLGGKMVNIPRDGSHAGQGNWQSSNAWDIKAGIGDPVYALAPGTAISYADYGESVIKTRGKKLFGTSFTVKGDQGFPDVYYTHLKNSTVNKGDKIQCGQLVGYVMDFPGSSYDHVHIGVQPGYNIRDLINDDGSIKCAKGIKVGAQSQSQNEKDPMDVMNASNFLQKFRDLAEQGKSFEYSPGMKIPFIPEVELIQTALQFLGFSLPRWGVDGKFGPETENAAKKFQEEYGLTENGKISEKELQYLTVLLVLKGFEDKDLSTIQRDKTIDVTNLTDKNFYEKLLKELGAPNSDENMKFLLAWRQAEGKAGKFNPFNTTHKMPNSTDFNKVGVKNYATLEDGLIATIKTLKNGRYDCIVNGLKNDIGAAQIAKCPSLKVWGTGDLVAKVVRGYESGSPSKASTLA